MLEEQIRELLVLNTDNPEVAVQAIVFLVEDKIKRLEALHDQEIDFLRFSLDQKLLQQHIEFQQYKLEVEQQKLQKQLDSNYRTMKLYDGLGGK